MPSIPQQGRTKIRDVVKTLVTHIGISTDDTAFADNQTELDPANVGAANVLIKASTSVDVDGNTWEETIDIDGDTEFTNKEISTIGNMDGSTRGDLVSRSVRTLSIGVQAGDLFTIGTRNIIEDNTL